jgi:membrane protease YdiL (CAAX protease family)
MALIVSSLAFGLYHYSLNFPLFICFAFAIGGFFIGGTAIKSKGLLSPILMHITVNLAFISIGIIF